MASTPEKKVKQQVVNVLKEAGAYYFYPVSGGFGASGIPDIVVCFMGVFIGIECKAGKNVPTALQEKHLAQIKEAGGQSLVVNEHNIEDVGKCLERIRCGHLKHQKDEENQYTTL